jgi:hypothetical protein
MLIVSIITFKSNAQLSIPQIHALAAYIKTIPFAEVPDDGFFEDSTAKAGCIYYVYSSYPNTIQSAAPGKFYYLHTDRDRAIVKRDSLRSAGLHTMLFESPASTGCWISECLLELSAEEAAFLMLHESMHYTYLRKQYRGKWNIPTEAEEAFCDVMANYYLDNCPLIDQKKYRKVRKKNEKVFCIINKTIDGKISHKKAQKRIQRKLRHASPFMHQRFNHEVNNAYLLRYAPYTTHYFKLKKQLGIKPKRLPAWDVVEKRLTIGPNITK